MSSALVRLARRAAQIGAAAACSQPLGPSVAAGLRQGACVMRLLLRRCALPPSAAQVCISRRPRHGHVASGRRCDHAGCASCRSCVCVRSWRPHSPPAQ